jgi:hypothetical protein
VHGVRDQGATGCVIKAQRTYRADEFGLAKYSHMYDLANAEMHRRYQPQMDGTEWEVMYSYIMGRTI